MLHGRRLFLLALLFFGAFAHGQVVVPDFGARGNVPEPVLQAFMREFRRQVASATEMAVTEGDLISPGIAGSLDAPLFASLLADLGEGRYGISGELSGPVVQDGATQYTVNLLIVDAQAQRSSDVLSRIFSEGRMNEAARFLAGAVRQFVTPEETILPAGSAGLFISSQPSEADVYVNGVFVGQTGRLEPLQLGGGRYEIEWRKEGFLPYYASVVAVDELIEFVHAPLTPVTTGSIRVTSRPNVTVYLDDRLVGQTPLTVPASPGQHTLRLERPGFHPESYRVNVQRSRVSRVEAELRPVESPLLFWEAPRGYLVYINGVVRARPFVSGLAAGEIVVELVSPEERIRFTVFLPAIGNFEIDFGERRLVPLGL